MTQRLLSDYQQRQNTFAKAQEETRRTINNVSNARLVVAALFLICIYLATKESLFGYSLPVLLAVFVVLVRKHSEHFERKVQLENLVKINEVEQQCLKGHVPPYGNGAEFIDPQHPYSHDLDVFGERSLFQYINRTTALGGKAALAGSFAKPMPSAEAILARQQAVEELSGRLEFRQQFQATGMGIDELKEDHDRLVEWVKHKPFLYGNKLWYLALIILPVMTMGAILGAFIFGGLTKVAIGLAMLQWLLLSTQLKQVNLFHQYVGQKKNILGKYAKLLHLFNREKFSSPLMQSLSERASDGDHRIQALAKLVNAFDARLNFMTNLFVNSVLMYDLQCVYRLEKWKEDHAALLESWIQVINETDVINSLATFHYNHPQFTFPTIQSSLVIDAKELGHPLLAHERCVTNTVTLGERQFIAVVTGANMAGKSTFLRTLGSNLVLALAGAPVYASSFKCPIIEMRTGMRTADSLQDHQSYFYAELHRLQRIMDELRTGKPLFILLDEILKGTNSTDKQAGSMALVKQLVSYSCIGLIATHDLALGELETIYPDKIKNYCFEPTIENDQLSFDYLLKEGIAQKMNATFLMKKMGIIPKGE